MIKNGQAIPSVIDAHSIRHRASHGVTRKIYIQPNECSSSFQFSAQSSFRFGNICLKLSKVSLPSPNNTISPEGKNYSKSQTGKKIQELALQLEEKTACPYARFAGRPGITGLRCRLGWICLGWGSARSTHLGQQEKPAQAKRMEGATRSHRGAIMNGPKTLLMSRWNLKSKTSVPTLRCTIVLPILLKPTNASTRKQYADTKKDCPITSNSSMHALK